MLLHGGLLRYPPPVAAHFQKRLTIDGENYDFYLDTSGLSFTHFTFMKVTPSHAGTLEAV